MTILCSILVVVNMGSVGWQATTQAEGKVITKSDSQYVADFSADLKKHKAKVTYDYKKVLVAKNKCVEL